MPTAVTWGLVGYLRGYLTEMHRIKIGRIVGSANQQSQSLGTAGQNGLRIIWDI